MPRRTLGELVRLSREAVEGSEGVTTTDPADRRRRPPPPDLGPAWGVEGPELLPVHAQPIAAGGAGIPDDRFGSAIITNYGVLGIDYGLVPLSPYSRCPLVIGIGHERPLPVVRAGEVVPAECVTISFTFDHRYADGIHGAQMMRAFRKIFLNPCRYPEAFSLASTPVPTEEPADGTAG